MKLSARSRKIVSEVLSCPTAPLHEEAVIRYVKAFAGRLGLPVQTDRYGNLKIIYRRGKKPAIAFAAHMDHPGFEVIQSKGSLARIRLLGGVHPPHFLRARIGVYCNGKKIRGKVSRPSKRDKKWEEHLFEARMEKPVSEGSFGCFDLPACRFKKGLIYTKGADNVINVALLLDFLEQMVTRQIPGHVYLLFTRAEEIGFVGASGALQEGFIPKNVRLVVLEASSAKHGKIKIGGGPALRVGDKFSTFSVPMDLWFRETAEKLSSQKKGFSYQRALLPGGRCEASLYVSRGYICGCLALPLGHYHNRGEKNYAAECVSEKDYTALIEWLKALVQETPSGTGYKKDQKRIQSRFARYGRRLKPVA